MMPSNESFPIIKYILFRNLKVIRLENYNTIGTSII